MKHNDPVRDLAFSPQNKKIISCSDDKSLRIYDFETGRVESILEGHGSDVTSVDWHPSYSLIASGGKDRIFKLWDPRTGQEVCSMYNHTNSVTKVRFSPRGEWVMTAGRDQTVKLFDVKSMRELKNYKAHEADVLSFEWNPAQPSIFASSDSSGKVAVWNVELDKPLCIMEHAADSEVWDLSWSNLGTMLATCGGDKLVGLWISRYFIPNQLNKDQVMMSAMGN